MVNSFLTFARVGKLKYTGNLPWYFNPKKCRYCSKLRQYSYNIFTWRTFGDCV